MLTIQLANARDNVQALYLCSTLIVAVCRERLVGFMFRARPKGDAGPSHVNIDLRVLASDEGGDMLGERFALERVLVPRAGGPELVTRTWYSAISSSVSSGCLLPSPLAMAKISKNELSS